MNPALVIIPVTCGTINRDKYLAECMKHVMNSGHFPLSKDVYGSYMNVDPDKFTKTMLGLCETAYLFIDFGMSDKMREMAEQAIKSDIPVTYVKIFNNEPPGIFLCSLNDILQDVSYRTKVPIESMKRKTRKREIVDARFIYFRRARDVFGKKISLAKIGMEIGRDHATVMHGIKEATETKEVVDQYRQYYGTGE